MYSQSGKNKTHEILIGNKGEYQHKMFIISLTELR